MDREDQHYADQHPEDAYTRTQDREIDRLYQIIDDLSDQLADKTSALEAAEELLAFLGYVSVNLCSCDDPVREEALDELEQNQQQDISF